MHQGLYAANCGTVWREYWYTPKYTSETDTGPQVSICSGKGVLDPDNLNGSEICDRYVQSRL